MPRADICPLCPSADQSTGHALWSNQGLADMPIARRERWAYPVVSGSDGHVPWLQATCAEAGPTPSGFPDRACEVRETVGRNERARRGCRPAPGRSAFPLGFPGDGLGGLDFEHQLAALLHQGRLIGV